MANELVLVVPGLLAQPPQALAAMRSLATIARYAGKPRIEAGGMAKALFAALGIDADTAVAPLALLGAGGDPRDDYVLRADPVHLAADRDRGLIVQTIDDLATDDAEALVRMLDRHFAGDDLRFEAVRPDAWFARRRQPASIATTPPDAAQGRNPMASMPSGPDSGAWKRWQNEIEMMLYDHPVNRAREARGALPVNAVWFSGGGRLVDVAMPPPAFVTAPQSRLGDLARGIARRAGATAAHDDIAQAVSRASAANAGGDVFTLAVRSRATDARDVEVAALAPALELLDARRLSAMHLVADGHGATVRWMAKAPGIWRRLAMRASHPAFEIPALTDA
jgi:hypothetical protein